MTQVYAKWKTQIKIIVYVYIHYENVYPKN